MLGMCSTSRPATEPSSLRPAAGDFPELLNQLPLLTIHLAGYAHLHMHLRMPTCTLRYTHRILDNILAMTGLTPGIYPKTDSSSNKQN